MNWRFRHVVPVAVAFLAAAPMPIAQEASRWRTEVGSVLTLEDDGKRVLIRYAEVQGAALRVGITPGTVIFTGERQGQGVVGKALAVFANGCRIDYPMQIAIHDGGSKLITRADAPIDVDASCRILQTAPRSFPWIRISVPTAQEILPRPDDPRVANMKLDCAYNPGIFGNPLAPPPIAIRARGHVVEWRDFVDGEKAQRFLDQVLSYARPHCQAERAERGIRGQVHDVLHVTMDSPRGTVLDARYSGGRWSVSNNAPRWAEHEQKEEAARKEREARLAEEARVAAEAAAKRRRNRELFVSSQGVVAFVSVHTLRTNPFPFRDKVVGVYASFSQMLSETDALFGDLLVTGLPATEFTVAGAEVVLAVKVLGLKQMKLPMGAEVPLPQGAYLGAFKCSQPRCSDFFDP